MPDISAAKVLTAEQSQYKALQCEMLEIEVDIIHAKETIICFGSKMSLSFIGIVQVFILIGITNFYIINIPTPFFFYLNGMGILDIYLNNITNQFICQNSKNITIFYKWGHYWFFSNKNKKIAASIYLTEVELCEVYTCFRHLLINK